MNKLTLLKSGMALAGISLLASGCVVREQVAYRPPPPVQVDATAGPGEVEVVGAPPAPVVETVTVAPDPGFVWVGGAWFWEGRWVWHAGHWARPPHRGAVWYGPHYVFRGGRHVWVRGYWR
jgi:hypothetical protein